MHEEQITQPEASPLAHEATVQHDPTRSDESLAAADVAASDTSARAASYALRLTLDVALRPEQAGITRAK